MIFKLLSILCVRVRGDAKRVSQLTLALPTFIAREIIVTRPRRLINSDSTRNYKERENRRKTKASTQFAPLAQNASPQPSRLIRPPRAISCREGVRGARRGAAASARSTGKQYYKHHAGPPGARLARVRRGVRGEAGRDQREKDDREQASDADDAAGVRAGVRGSASHSVRELR